MTWPQMDNRDALVTSCLLTFAEIMHKLHGICCTCCHELYFLSWISVSSGRYH